MYELGFYIPEDGILHSHGHENLKSCMHEELGYSIVSSFHRVGNSLDGGTACPKGRTKYECRHTSIRAVGFEPKN
jgi:hypothetical protein